MMSLLRRLAPLGLLTLLCQCQPFAPPPAVPPYPRYPSSPSAPDSPAYPSYPAYPTAAPTPDATPSPTSPPLYPSYPNTSAAAPTSSGQALIGGAQHFRQSVVVAGESVRLDIIRFDSRNYRLRVIDQPDPNAGGRAIAALMRSQGAAAGINGGFFTPTFQPMGLVIAHGRRTGSLTRTSLISGAILQTASRPRLIWNSEFQGTQGVTDLLQAGPRLVHDQRPISGLDASKKRPRSFIATDGGTGWAIGTTDSCSLATLATLLATPGSLPGLTIHRALNLDGGRSTALWFRTADGRESSSPSWSTVRNYLAIVPN